MNSSKKPLAFRSRRKQRQTLEHCARSSGNAVFDRLVAAGQRLLTVITRNKGGANKDLSKFADQINSLCDKWDR